MYEVLLYEENKIKTYGLPHDRVLFENYFQMIRQKRKEDRAGSNLGDSATTNQLDRPTSGQHLQMDLRVSLLEKL